MRMGDEALRPLAPSWRFVLIALSSLFALTSTQSILKGLKRRSTLSTVGSVNLDCDFDSPCCWAPASKDEQWSIQNGHSININEFRRIFLVGKSKPPPGGNYVMRVQKQRYSAYISCPFCSETGMVIVQYRHWQSPSATIRVCWQEENSPHSSGDVYSSLPSSKNCITTRHSRQSLLNSHTFYLPKNEQIRFIFIIENMTPLSATSVILVDRIRIIGEQCKAHSSQVLVGGMLNETRLHQSPDELLNRPKTLSHHYVGRQEMAQSEMESSASIPPLNRRVNPIRKILHKNIVQPPLALAPERVVLNPANISPAMMRNIAPRPLISTGMDGKKQLRSNERFRKLAVIPNNREQMQLPEQKELLPPLVSKSEEAAQIGSELEAILSEQVSSTTEAPRPRPRLHPTAVPELPPSQNWKPLGDLAAPPQVKPVIPPAISKVVNAFNPLNDLLGEDMVNFLDPNYETKEDLESDDSTDDANTELNKDVIDIDNTFPIPISDRSELPSSPTPVQPKMSKIEGPFPMVTPAELTSTSTLKKTGGHRSRKVQSAERATATREETSNMGSWGEPLQSTENVEVTQPPASIPTASEAPTDDANKIRISLGNESIAINREPIPIQQANPLLLHHHPFTSSTVCSTPGGCLFERGLCGWSSPPNIPLSMQFQKNTIHFSNFIQARVPPGEISILQTETSMSESHTVLFDSLEFRLGTRLIGCCFTSQETPLHCPFATPSEATHIIWQISKFDCPAGTKRLLFFCENFGIEEGLCAIDNVRIHKTIDVFFLDPCQKNLLSVL